MDPTWSSFKGDSDGFEELNRSGQLGSLIMAPVVCSAYCSLRV